MQFESGVILKYNRLWRSGMHYEYTFFKVTHITAKGTIMGKFLHSTRTNEAWDHDARTDCWRVHATQTCGKTRRLPHPRLWQEVEEEDLVRGIRATSCVA